MAFSRVAPSSTGSGSTGSSNSNYNGLGTPREPSSQRPSYVQDLEPVRHKVGYGSASLSQSPPPKMDSTRSGTARKKVLLMGKSGSGKTSMRSVIFSNHLAENTRRLGATIDVEQSQHRFLSDLMLNLWDCGGQETFMENYLRHDRQQVFSSVQLLIYVFDAVAREHEKEKDYSYYVDCLNAVKEYSPDASIFVLIHKMDLIGPERRKDEFLRKKKELLTHSEDFTVRVFGTSIWDESLYRAWSRIVHILIPNADKLTVELDRFIKDASSVEAVIFEKTTMLLIAWSTQAGDFSKDSLDDEDDEMFKHQEDEVDSPDGQPQLPPDRFEKISSLIKAWRHIVVNSRIDNNPSFENWYQEWNNFTSVLEYLTGNTYILVIACDPIVHIAAIRLQIELVRAKFTKLQAGSNK